MDDNNERCARLCGHNFHGVYLLKYIASTADDRSGKIHWNCPTCRGISYCFTPFGFSEESTHTVFFVTNFWETISKETEVTQGKTVADASKAAGVKHLVFSSLINVSDASQGRLVNVKHFDSKAEIEGYIQSIGVPASFVQAGMFMSNWLGMIRKQEDGSYCWAHPTARDVSRFPAFDVVADTGKYVKIALKKFPELVGKRLLAAHHYYTATEIMDQWMEVTGKKLEYVEITPEMSKKFLPPGAADELVETMLLMANVGYYGGADLAETNGLLEEPATTWREFVKANKEKW